MRWLVAVVVLVLGFVGLAELLLVPALEEVVAQRIAAAGLGERRVTVALSGFPVVARVVGTGEVERAVVTLEDVPTSGVTFSEVRADVRGTALDRSAVVDGEVTFESVERVDLTGQVTAAEITRLLPVGVTDLVLTPGAATVDVLGQQMTAQVTVTDGVLRVAPGGETAIDVALPAGELFPCVLAGAIGDGVLEVSCAVEQVPPWLLEEAGAELRL